MTPSCKWPIPNQKLDDYKLINYFRFFLTPQVVIAFLLAKLPRSFAQIAHIKKYIYRPYSFDSQSTYLLLIVSLRHFPTVK